MLSVAHSCTIILLQMSLVNSAKYDENWMSKYDPEL